MIIDIPDIRLVYPELFVVGMTCIVLLAGVFAKAKTRLNTVYALAQFTVVVSIVLSVRHMSFHESQMSFNNSFVIDHLALMSKFFIYFISFFTFLYAKTEIQKLKLPSGEYYGLCMFSMLGMMVLVSSTSLLCFYLGLELLSFPLYALVAINRRSALGAEAAMKYFVTGALASGLMLYGLSLVYGVAHSFQYQEIAVAVAHLSQPETVILMSGVALLVIGFAFKLGLAPFHMWVPDVYQGAPASITLFITSAPKVAVFTLLVRILFVAFKSHYAEWSGFIIFLCMVSIAWGNLAAMVQTNLKRLLAYSAIANMGFMMLGIISGTSDGMGASMFYVVTYAIMSAGAFGVIVILNAGGAEIEELDDLKGLNARNPWLAFVLLLLFFSMAGVPPMVGFISKVGVLLALIKAHYVWLAVYAICFAVIASFYYLRVIKIMYFDDAKATQHSVEYPVDMTVAVALNGIAVLVLGIFPSLLLELCYRSFM